MLVPVFLVWSNFHSGFVIGLGFIAIVLVAEVLGAWLHMPDPAPRERLRPLLLVLIASIAVSMINPNGPSILLYALGTQTSGAQQSLIEEWFSPSFHDWEVLVYGAMLLSLAMLIVFNKRIRARDVALVLVTTALSLQSARHIALFVAAATPVYIDQLGLADTANERSGAAPARELRRAPALACNRHCSSASRRARCSWRDSEASTSHGWCRRCDCSPTHWRTRRSFRYARRSGSPARPSR